MKIYAFNQGVLRLWLPPKILLIMKMIIVLLTTCLMQVSAAGFAQKLSYSKKGASLEELFKQITLQTGYNVLYSPEKIEESKKIDVDFRNIGLKEALDRIIKNELFEYTIDDKNIIIKPKETSFLDRVKDVTLNLFQGQAIDVYGRVVDENGSALAGATVRVKNGKGSAITGADGRFTIKNVENDAVLVISYLGYVNKEVAVNTDLTGIVMVLSDNKLDEVQVIAYGTQQKKFSTNTIATITAEEIARQPVSNPLLALHGKVPGLFISQVSGVNGSDVNVTIQGKNSLNSGNNPFYVIDGVPYSPQFTDFSLGSGAFRGFSSSFNFVNPSDIERIDILKDADATAIYGSRGANGVVLITTKKGKPGRVKIGINANTGFTEV
ncbi:MAG: SusC/RagA family TonB-linked outer membrane protein, partial [Chryseobacterium sp.]